MKNSRMKNFHTISGSLNPPLIVLHPTGSPVALLGETPTYPSLAHQICISAYYGAGFQN